jgi:hypothetical protein
MMKTALILAALLTRHVLLERVVNVLLGHALRVRPVRVAARPAQEEQKITSLKITDTIRHLFLQG